MIKKIGKDTDTTDPDSLADQPLPKRRRTDRHEHESEGNVAADRVAVEKQAGGGKADSESDRTLKRTGQYYSDHSYLKATTSGISVSVPGCFQGSCGRAVNQHHSLQCKPIRVA